MTQASGQAGRRDRAETTRENVVKVRLSDEERAVLGAAAARDEMALAAWLGKTGMDAAEHRAVPVPKMQREMLAELMRVAGLVRRAGTNFNQAVARLNATGQPGPDLEPSAAFCIRAVRQANEAADLIRRRLG